MSIRTARNGQPTGVWELPALQAAVNSGEVQSTDLVWTRGFQDWKKLSEVASEIGISLPVPEDAVPPIPGSSRPTPPPIPKSPLNPVSSQIPMDIQGASDLRLRMPDEIASKRTKGLDPGIKVLLYAIVGFFVLLYVIAQFDSSRPEPNSASSNSDSDTAKDERSRTGSNNFGPSTGSTASSDPVDPRCLGKVITASAKLDNGMFQNTKFAYGELADALIQRGQMSVASARVISVDTDSVTCEGTFDVEGIVDGNSYRRQGLNMRWYVSR